MTARLLILALLFTSPALAKTKPGVLLTRGDDGPAVAKQERLESQEDLDRWKTGLEFQKGRTLVAIGLGEQPAGTRVLAARVRDVDKYGWEVQVRLRVTMPYKARKTIRPFVILSLEDSPLSVKKPSIQVALHMKGTTLQPMSLERAVQTRDRLAHMPRRLRRQVTELHDANEVLGRRLKGLEKQVVLYADDPGYAAARRAQSFRESLTASMEIAGLETDLAIFGTTANPMISTGDESLRYLSVRRKKDWGRQVATGYATERAELEKSILELQEMLASMRALAAKHQASKQGLTSGLLGLSSKR
jgi:hypothetical protein